MHAFFSDILERGPLEILIFQANFEYIFAMFCFLGFCLRDATFAIYVCCPQKLMPRMCSSLREMTCWTLEMPAKLDKKVD